MANELKHGSVGTELTQAEWEAVGTHVVANQAVGDIIYADTTSQLLRLGVGSTNDVLRVSSAKPSWSATLAGLTLTTPTISSTGFANANHAHAASNSGGTISAGALSGTTLASGVVTTSATTVGTIATGVWQGTDVGVAYGGTGVSTLTANGVLVGNGSSAIGSIDMSTKGHVLIGDGSGNPQMLGVGTNTHVLTADSGETTGIKWAAPAAAAAGSLTGATLASGVTASSLASLGTVTTDIQLDANLDFVGPQSITTTTGDLDISLANGGSLDVNAASTTHAVVFDVQDSAGVTRFHVSPISAHASGNENLVQLTGQNVLLTGSDPTTISEFMQLSVGQPTFTGSNANQVVTTAATLKIASSPSASGNAAITNSYAIWVDGGDVRLDAGAIIGTTTSLSNRIDDASSGSGSTTLYIGNRTIDTTSSDARLKREIVAATDAYATETVDKLVAALREFDWDTPSSGISGHAMGLIAQELDAVLPEFVRKPTVDSEGVGSDSYWSVSYQSMVPYLLKVVAMQGAELTRLAAFH